MDKRGNTALHGVAYLKRCDAVELLLRYGADVNSLNVATPLMLASAAFRIDLVKLFLAHAADVNKTNKYGVTALVFTRNTVSQWGETFDRKQALPIIRILLEHGADPNIVAYGYATALVGHLLCPSK